MILKRCKNGHYYDGDKYQKCPHCLTKDQNARPHARHVLKRNSSLRNSNYMAAPIQQQQDDVVTMPIHQQDDPVTMPLTSLKNDLATLPLSSLQNDSTAIPSPRQQDDPVTMPLSTNKCKSADCKAALLQGRRLAVGWLVCVKGKDFGTSFTIRTGKNYIGRTAKMDIVLHKDDEAVRENHAVVYYVPKQKMYVAEPGETRDLFYLNNEVVLNPVKIKKKDILTIGNTSLMFFPLCGEDFNWADMEKDI